MDPGTSGPASEEVVPTGEDYRILTIISEAIWKGYDSSPQVNQSLRKLTIGDSVQRAEHTLRKLREAGYEIVREVTK